uniref:Ribosomal protein L33 n=1 Tax=Romanomermis culicivorax TaxID=13658 RepID=A0A915JTJ4_ROMCU
MKRYTLIVGNHTTKVVMIKIKKKTLHREQNESFRSIRIMEKS